MSKTEASNISPIQKWLLIYVGLCTIGAFVLFGGFFGWSQQSFAGWEWWQRALLIFCIGPFATVAFVLAHALLEGIFGVVLLGFKHAPLQTAVALGVLGAAVGLVASLF